MSTTIEQLDDRLTVTLSGLARVLALRKRVSVRYEAIDTVEVGATVPPAWTPRAGYAMPGSARRHGTFYLRGAKRFFDVRDAEHAVTLRLKPGAEWSTVSIRAEDPDALAASIRRRLGR